MAFEHITAEVHGAIEQKELNELSVQLKEFFGGHWMILNGPFISKGGSTPPPHKVCVSVEKGDGDAAEKNLRKILGKRIKRFSR